MLIKVNTVRFKMLSVLMITLLGISALALNAYISDLKLTKLDSHLTDLLVSREHLEVLKELLEENNRLLIQIVFRRKTELSGLLLAKNEDILHEFEEFRNDAQRNQLDEDFNFAVENEPLVLSLRKDFYTLVASVRKKSQPISQQQQLFRFLDHRVKPLLGFMRNSEILRNLRINDTRQELSLLKIEIFRNTVIIYSVIFILTLLIILLIARNITRPLASLLNTILQISHGQNLSVRATISSSDEIGELALFFNKLIEQLEASTNQTNLINESLEQSKNQLAQQAKKQKLLIGQLEDKNSELERFTYTVSHDLKSPLVTIKGFIGLLIQDIKNKQTELVNKDLQQIASAADKMAALLDDLLELSRVGRVVNHPKILSLTQLFEDTLNLVHGQIEKSGAIIKIQANMPSIYADKHRMQEVAQNLLDNAIKFTHKDTVPKISVSATISGDQVICCISDNGIGIKPEYHQQIFGLFDRLDPSYEGTGVGLALVKRIIEVHNGSISIEQANNEQGSKFCFSLPNVSQG